MRIRSGLLLGLTALTSVAFAAGAKTRPHGDGADARNQALLSYQRDLVSVLAPRADALPLLGAALLARPLSKQPKYNDFHSLIERAAKADDASPAVQWVRLADCDGKAGACPNAEALDALVKQAPDNAAVWLIKLGKDHGAGNDDAAKEHLAKAADARLYDDYTGISLKALATTAGTLPAPAAAIDPGSPSGPYGVQMVMVFGLAELQPQPQPGMQAAAKLCTEGKDDAAMKAQCLKLAHVLEWGSSPLSRSLGLHLREALSDDPAEQAAARVSMASLAWQVKQFSGLAARAPGDKAQSQHLLALARSGGTEMSTVLAALRQAGIPTDAPEATAGGTASGEAAGDGTAPSK